MTPTQGLLDTSVVIDIDRIDGEDLPETSAISIITLAELAAGPHSTDSLPERASRQQRLQWTEQTFSAIPLDADAARAYGSIVAAVRAQGRRPRRRMADLLIAATAMSRQIPLYTRNPADFIGLDSLVDIHAV